MIPLIILISSVYLIGLAILIYGFITAPVVEEELKTKKENQFEDIYR